MLLEDYIVSAIRVASDLGIQIPWEKNKTSANFDMK